MNELPLATGANWLAHVDQMATGNAMEVMLTEAELLAEDGYAGAELPMPHVEGLRDDLDESFWREVGESMRAMGVEPVSVHGPNLPPLDADVKLTSEKLRWYARSSVALGVRALVVHPTTHTHPHVCTIVPKLLERDIELSYVVSDELLAHDHTGGVQLALENLPTYGMRYLEELMTRIDRTNVGVCLDTGHWMVRPEGTVESFVARFVDRIAHLHLTDNHGLCDEHLAPGMGTFPWAKFFNALPDTAKRGPLLLELNNPALFQDVRALEQGRKIRTDALKISRGILSRYVV